MTRHPASNGNDNGQCPMPNAQDGMRDHATCHMPHATCPNARSASPAPYPPPARGDPVKHRRLRLQKWGVVLKTCTVTVLLQFSLLVSRPIIFLGLRPWLCGFRVWLQDQRPATRHRHGTSLKSSKSTMKLLQWTCRWLVPRPPTRVFLRLNTQ